MDKIDFVVADEREGYLGRAHDFEKLRQINRELVEALKMFIAAGYGNSTHFGIQEEAYNLARAALAKSKGEA